MKILIDNNLPIWWALNLRRAGHDALHVLDCSLADKTDDDIRRTFASEPILFISRDSDFWHNCPPGWSLIWVNIHNPKISDLSSWIYDCILRAIRDILPSGRCMVTEDGIIHLHA